MIPKKKKNGRDTQEQFKKFKCGYDANDIIKNVMCTWILNNLK